MNTRRITLVAAIVLAVGVCVLTLRYLGTVSQQAAPATVAMRAVVIANRDIPARARITPDMLARVSRPATSVDAGAFGNPKLAIGNVALLTVPAGTVLTVADIGGKQAEVGAVARLQPGLRAVSIPVDRVKDVSGLLQPGDRVDVLATVGKPGDAGGPRTATIIRGAQVLAVNAQLESTVGASAPPSAAPQVDGGSPTVTLAVTPAQADLLTLADLDATLRLALRSPQEPVRSLPPERLVFGSAATPEPAAPPVMYPAPATAAPATSAPATAAPAPPAERPVAAAPPPAVEVIDGDRVTSRSN